MTKTQLPEYFMTSSIDGSLYDTRVADWHHKEPVRKVYKQTFSWIETTAELKATLRAGKRTFPGCYPMFFITSDGAALSFESVRSELRQVLDAIRTRSGNGWRVVACEVNWEDGKLTCEHSGKRIESAYAEDSTDGE